MKTTRRISKKLRADAAHILQVVASNYDWNYGITNTYAAEQEISGTYQGTPAGDLARRALATVATRHHGRHAYAEAECMLLEGWNP